MLDQFAHKQLLGPLMHLIKILRHALETGRAADRLPARRFVARATEELGVNKTFHRQNRMPVRFLPILRQSIQILPHHGAGQIGMFVGGDEQTETRVIRHQRQSPTPLRVIPTDPSVAPLQVVGRGRPSQQRQPSTFMLCHVPELFAHQLGGLEIMVFADLLLTSCHLLGSHATHQDFGQKSCFGWIGDSKVRLAHARKKNKIKPDCPASALTPPFVAP